MDSPNKAPTHLKFKMDISFSLWRIAGIISLIFKVAEMSIQRKTTCGATLKLDCGPEPIVITSILSSHRIFEKCQHDKLYVDNDLNSRLRHECEGEKSCEFSTGFIPKDKKYLGVYYDCGQSHDMCSDVTIYGNKSYLYVQDQTDISGPASCRCKSKFGEGQPGTEVSITIVKKDFGGSRTNLTLKWRKDATFYIDQAMGVSTEPYKHVISDIFELVYDANSGKNELQLYYETDTRMTLVCNNGSGEPTTGPLVDGHSTSSQMTSVDNGGQSQSSIGAIIGGIVAVLLLAVVVIVVVVILRRRRNASPVEKGDEVGHESGDETYETIPELNDKKHESFLNDSTAPIVPSSPTKKVSISEDDAGGEYTEIDMEDKSYVQLQKGKHSSNGGQKNRNDPIGRKKKGFLDRLGRKFRAGAGNKRESDDAKGTVKDSLKSEKSSKENGGEDQKGNYNQLDLPVLSKPKTFKPPKGNSTYNQITRRGSDGYGSDDCKTYDSTQDVYQDVEEV